jgi:uncharacterized membrane protein
MTRTIHTLFIISMVAIVILVTVYLGYTGYSYYQLPLEERFYHPETCDWFKPSGAYRPRAIGILGTLMILFGVVTIYIARKRYNFMAKQLRLQVPAGVPHLPVHAGAHPDPVPHRIQVRRAWSPWPSGAWWPWWPAA